MQEIIDLYKPLLGLYAQAKYLDDKFRLGLRYYIELINGDGKTSDPRLTDRAVGYLYFVIPYFLRKTAALKTVDTNRMAADVLHDLKFGKHLYNKLLIEELQSVGIFEVQGEIERKVIAELHRDLRQRSNDLIAGLSTETICELSSITQDIVKVKGTLEFVQRSLNGIFSGFAEHHVYREHFGASCHLADLRNHLEFYQLLVNRDQAIWESIAAKQDEDDTFNILGSLNELQNLYYVFESALSMLEQPAKFFPDNTPDQTNIREWLSKH
jgi:hypothetical protein